MTAICYLPTSNNATVIVAPPVILESYPQHNEYNGGHIFKVAPFIPVPPTETLSSIIYELYQHKNNNRILYTGVITNNFASEQNVGTNLPSGSSYTLRVKFRTVSGFESAWTVSDSYE